MSDYYDLFFTLELRPDLSEEVRYEIRYHFGLEPQPPARFRSLPDDGWYLDEPYPYFTGIAASHAFPGADVAALVTQDDRTVLTVRQCIHDDELGWALELTQWLAEQSIANGWIGFLGFSPDPDAPKTMYYEGGALAFSVPGPPTPRY
ncbi:hypothetical protein KZZ52_51565 [Dactylosporangium sp. AC04546]|uniref:hypothetical protein n=1 Tax=Dactylosporangium sp. AC04546 TaxID=2862460 RepID=UPI001EDFD362|nr:hypothetical protein [Dactylosporangium sp. AC04546]WVK82300.1 hypothetical protein KZZ52_51565 [Dactylosporangium sp. AC04546]